jgi:transmembrane sensor
MNEKEILDLFDRYSEGSCTPEEASIVESWFLKFEQPSENYADTSNYDEIGEEVWAKLETQFPRKKPLSLYMKYAAVAALVVAVFGAGLFYYTNEQKTNIVATVANDIAPGKNGATITLASGKVIQLSGTKAGVVVGNELKYNDNTPVIPGDPSRGNESSPGPANTRDLSQGRDDGRVQLLTAETQKGQTYQFTLPDGTKVWLNADSKISFPTQFNGKERKILLSGEAYFAVKHNAKQPFRVESNGQVVEDIGTEFNINAYADENSTKTTLVEGSAKVNMVLLQPNQQAILSPFGGDGAARGGKLNVIAVNLEEIIAWKNGYFRFNDQHIESIMKQLARWYNIEVVYQGKIPTDGFNGKVSRNKNISQVLKALEATKIVHFKVEGRRVTVIE